MSNTYYETDKLSLTATVQGVNANSAIQLTVEDSYVILDREEQIELVTNLLLRISGNISATDMGEGVSNNKHLRVYCLSDKISYAPIEYPSGVSTAGRLFKDDLKETIKRIRDRNECEDIPFYEILVQEFGKELVE